jgi:predicted nucleotidyltransferase component of viral defense system
MLHRETIGRELADVARALVMAPELNAFRIVGGTAVALHIGHRTSVDIDFFSNDKVSKQSILRFLKDKFPGNEFFVTEHNILGEIEGVRVDLYDDWMIPFKRPAVVADGLRLASMEDLAAFKLSCITERREKKDYIDLFFLFKELGSQSVLRAFKDYNPLLSEKSILFALSEVRTAAENKSPMPNMLMDVGWNEIEASMIQAAKQYVGKARDSR